jgi:DNA-binding NtrC family response regulator
MSRPSAQAAASAADPNILQEVERRPVLEIMRQKKGNTVHAARALGISRRALYRLLAKYGVSKHDVST